MTPPFLPTVARLFRRRSTILGVLLGGSIALHSQSIFALPPSPGKVPHGDVNDCLTCHVPNDSTYAKNTQMKLDFLAANKTWTSNLASKDSDDDGFTNGEELQDLSGTWSIGQQQPGNKNYVANPSQSSSTPPNAAIQSIGAGGYGTVSLGTVVSNDVNFYIQMQSEPLGTQKVEYTVRNSSNAVVFQATSTSSNGSYDFWANAWDSTLVPDGTYSVTAKATEKRRKSGVTPRTTSKTTSFTVDNPTYLFYADTSMSVSEGVGKAQVTLKLNQATNDTVSVKYKTIGGGSATSGSDYDSTSGTLTINPGETSKSFGITIKDDTIDENDETIVVQLDESSASGAVVKQPYNATVTIKDNESAPTVQFDQESSSVAEGNTNVVLTVKLSSSAKSTVSVKYATRNGSATSGSDYTAANGTLTFSPGETSKTITVAIKADSADEQDEVVYVDLSSPSNATLGSPKTVALTILGTGSNANPTPSPTPSPTQPPSSNPASQVFLPLQAR